VSSLTVRSERSMAEYGNGETQVAIALVWFSFSCASSRATKPLYVKRNAFMGLPLRYVQFLKGAMAAAKSDSLLPEQIETCPRARGMAILSLQSSVSFASRIDSALIGDGRDRSWQIGRTDEHIRLESRERQSHKGSSPLASRERPKRRSRTQVPAKVVTSAGPLQYRV
jgi:hypothetical protein